MSQSPIDLVMIKSVKQILKDPEIHSLFCDYMRNVLAYKQIFILPSEIKQVTEWELIRERLEISRQRLDLTLQLHTEFCSICKFIMQLGRLPVSEIDRILDIVDIRRRYRL